MSVVNDDLSTMLSKMTLVRLKKELKKRNLRTTGVKNELVLRLLEVMQTERENNTVVSSEISEYENSHDEDENDESDDEGETTVVEKKRDEMLHRSKEARGAQKRRHEKSDDKDAATTGR